MTNPTWSTPEVWSDDKAISTERLQKISDDLNWLRNMNFALSESKTIASGVITVTGTAGMVLVDTESAANADDLDTISGGVEDNILVLFPASATHLVTLKHGTGNISLPGAADINLRAAWCVMLRYDGANWQLMSVACSDPELQPWINNSGGSVGKGDVFIFDKSQAQSFTTTTLSADKRILGVGIETIANGAWGLIARRGLRIVNVQGNVNIGQALISSTTVKRAAANGGAVQDGYIGFAVTAYAGGGAGTVIAECDVKTDRTGGQATQVSVTKAANSTVSVPVTGTNHLLVAICFQQGTGVINGCTYGGVSMTKACGSGGANEVAIFYLLAPALGTAALTYTYNGTPTQKYIVGILFNDVNQSTPVGTGVVGSGTNNSPSVSGSATPGDYAIGAFGVNAAETLSGRGGSQAELVNDVASGGNRFICDKIDPATASPAFTWTKSGAAAWWSAYLNIYPL